MINFSTDKRITIKKIFIFKAYLLVFAERAERSEAAELICHLSAWCKLYMKFHLLREF